MNLADISIKNPVFAWMLMIALILFGAIMLKDIGISEMPDADFPVITVSAEYRGAAPEIMESQISDVIEEAMMSLEGIKHISSSNREGRASITAEFVLERDINEALQDVQNKLAQTVRRLPNDMEPLTINKTNPEDNPIMWISLSSDNRSLREMIDFARKQVKDRLQTVSGVGEVMVSGYVEPNMRIWIDPIQLKAFELSIQDVLDAFNREHVESPVGDIQGTDTQYNLRYMGEATTPEQIENLLITHRGGKQIFTPIKISQIAKVEKGLDDILRMSRTNGKTALGLGIKKQRGYNSVALGDAVKKRLEEIRKDLPDGYSLQINFDSTKYIRDSINEMRFELLISALLTGLVCFIFLASIKSTFNILLAIPTSIMGAFFFIGQLGFTLNNFTLLGLTLAIGIVVDDAIMVLENIVRHQELKESPMQAAVKGTKEITSAAIATTLAVIAIFVPMVFIKGTIGVFFYQFGMVITITVALSLLEAITFTPMRSSRISYIQHNPSWWARTTQNFFEELSLNYKRVLATCLHYKWLTIIISILIFVGSLGIVPKIKKEFVPAQDRSSFLIQASAPIGSSINFTDRKMRELETIMAAQPEVERYFLAVGGFGGGESDKAMMFVTLKQPKDRPIDAEKKRRLSQDEIMEVVRNKAKIIEQLKVVPLDMSLRGFTSKRGQSIEFSLRGPDQEQLIANAQKLMKTMSADPHFKDVDSDYRFGQSEIKITPLREEAMNRGVRIADIATVINALIGGVHEGKVTEDGRRNDIHFRLQNPEKLNIEDIKKLFVRNNEGELIPLSQLVLLEERKTLQSIIRDDRERSINISSNLGENIGQQAALDRLKQLSKETLPDGYRMVLSGASESFKEAFSGLGIAMLMGFIVAYMVLASQYNSYIHPVTVLMALPFSFTGAFLFLWGFDQSLNLYSFIGLILLMGIAKKNSILLVDFTNQERAKGSSVIDSLLSACPHRLRPILMTSITIIAAAIPTAIGFGPGAEVRVPMSLVIIGGMIFSTFLTLFVVPCFYLVLSKLERTQNH